MKILKIVPLLLTGMVVAALFAYRPLPESAGMTITHQISGTDDTALGRAIGPLVAAHPDLQGIYSLRDGRDAFVARAALANAAERSIDAQYYIWRNDTAGRLLLQSLRRAADRGVRVRLLLDDNNTKGMDALLCGLNAHPRIEVRLFNPFMHRRARILDFLGDFSRANRRMHNKTFTVDQQATVVGGRNVGDEYFGAGDGVMFADLDVLAVGPVVHAVSSDFDRYWASESSYPVDRVIHGTAPSDIGVAPADDPASREYLQSLQRSTLMQQLREQKLPWHWAAARFISDDPAKGLGKAEVENTLVSQLAPVIMGAKRDLTIVSPYFVPRRAGTKRLVSLARSGVPVTVLTNALAATDVAAVHAGYVKYRTKLLRGGVKLYELKHNATIVETSIGGVTGSSGASLHAKTFAVDGRQVFVGSYNLDPRSARLNTEMGLLIDSPVLARQLSQVVVEHGLDHAYAVTLADDQLRWNTREDGQTLTFRNEPQSSWIDRMLVRILTLLPIEHLL